MYKLNNLWCCIIQISLPRFIDVVHFLCSEESRAGFRKWAAHDSFCYLDDESSAEYVDLLLNPERYTGYAGPSAHRVWNTIYQENCFK